MGPLYYFAYGSNLHPLRLRERARSARVLGRGHLRGYRLRFHKRGRDLSAKCDAWWTGRREYLVQGVVYRIGRGDRRLIDRAEDRGRGYDSVRLLVSMRGRPRLVFTIWPVPRPSRRGCSPSTGTWTMYCAVPATTACPDAIGRISAAAKGIRTPRAAGGASTVAWRCAARLRIDGVRPGARARAASSPYCAASPCSSLPWRRIST